MSYGDLLRDPRWQKKRLEMLEAAEWKCTCCERTTETFHVHHVHYRKGAMPWEYDSSELRVLCETCHTNIHLAQQALREIVDGCGLSTLARLAGYAQAIWAIDPKNLHSDGTAVAYSQNQTNGIRDALSEFGITCDQVLESCSDDGSHNVNVVQLLAKHKAAKVD
jgi:hypothetical protein